MCCPMMCSPEMMCSPSGSGPWGAQWGKGLAPTLHQALPSSCLCCSLRIYVSLFQARVFPLLPEAQRDAICISLAEGWEEAEQKGIVDRTFN